MGGIHFDFATKDIWLWRTWDNGVPVEPPARWDGWTLHDCGYDYRLFYRSVPEFISFGRRTDRDYVERVRSSIFWRSRGFSPHGFENEDREAMFEKALQGSLADPPEPVPMPDLR